ncbi:MAG: M56 family metallopeptidase [Bryobacteraceae bacterium]|jgi:TonB family protein
MNTALVWSNILAYSLQVGLLVAVAAFVPALVRMRAAGARLLYWQLLLAACLLLPWLRPWHQEVIAANVSVTTVVTSMAAAPAPARFHIAPGELLLYLLAAGVAARLAWLGVGLWRLRRYRRRAVPLENAGVRAEVLLSAEISSPVTFGWRRPVILLPERFPQLGGAMQQAILCHENLHVERHDWLFTVAEELVRAVLWFHPAIWWLLGEIQLAREQAVDCQVVKITQSRDPYVDALLEMAGAPPELDLAPAPLFLRKRHLKQRVMEIVREATMSKTRWISALAASVMFLAAACWLVTGAFPLAGAPQIVADAPGVAVDLGGARLMHRSGVEYPAAAIAKGVQGTVVAQVKLDANGVVTDASILSGPDELRKAVLQSVLNWHFYKDAAGAMRQVSVTFELPKEGAAAPSTGVGGGVKFKGGSVGVGGGVFVPPNSVLKSITVSGLSDQAKADLLARLPVHEGDALTPDTMEKVGQVVKGFDEHLHVGVGVLNGNAQMHISPYENTSFANGETAIPIQADAQAINLISKVDPVYPPLAKQAKIQGTVELSAVIGKDGRVQNLKVVSGHPLLVQAALDAVKNWVYRPTLVNGEPVEVKTSIQINFTLASSENIEPANRLEVSGNAQAAKLITQVAPEYPAAAKQAGIQGTVVLEAIVGKDGTVQDVKALSGPPLLAQAALDAVKNWVYQPTLLNGEPVEVKTTIQVNFTLE